jgi:hypothetical protein
VGIQIQQTKYQAVPTGKYPAIVDSLEDDPDGMYGPQIKWTFRIDMPGSEYHKVTMPGWTSATFSPKSKLYGWTRAAFARDIPYDYVWDSDHILGKRVLLVVVEKVKADGSEFSKVDDVRAMVPGVGAVGPQPVAAAEAEALPF